MTAQPGTAAPPNDGWEVNLAPLYLWASEIDGEMRVNDATVPVFMSFVGASYLVLPNPDFPAGRSAGPAVEYDVTHDGPLVALNLRCGR